MSDKKDKNPDDGYNLCSMSRRNMEYQGLLLSQYNESLVKRNSTSMKFDWKNLLGDPSDSGTNDKDHRLNESENLGGFERKLLDDDLKSRVALSSRGLDESMAYESLARESYHANAPARYSQDDTYCMKDTRTGTISLESVDKEFPGALRSHHHITSGGDNFNVEMIDSTIVHDVHHGQMHGRYKVAETCLPADTIPVQGKREYGTYSNGWRVRRGCVFRESDGFHVDATVPDGCSHSCLPVTSTYDSTVDKIEERGFVEHSKKSRVWYNDPCLQRNEILGNNGLNMSRSQKLDTEVLDCESDYGRYEREQYFNHRSPLSGVDHGYERSEMSHESEYGQRIVNYDHSSFILEENYAYERSESNPFIESNQYISENANDLPQTLAENDLCLSDTSPLMLKREYGIIDGPINVYIRDTISSDDERGLKYYHQGDAFERLSVEDRQGYNLSKKPRSSHSQFKQFEMESYETSNDWNYIISESLSPKNMSELEPRSVTERNPAAQKIKERLGPRNDMHTSSGHYMSTQEASVRNRLGPVEKSKPSVRQRLGPGHKMNPSAVPRMKNQIPKKLCQTDFDDYDYYVEKEPLGADVISKNVEPPENSQEFKQLVHSAYLRFVKQLNETSAQRKRILEQGKAGRLKCLICGSNSKEFVDTKSLAMHTFFCQKVGFRALHLGFHRALCMLMGWKEKTTRGHNWFCDSLSDSEALSLKEDLIIWPPVVIIHNSSLNSNDVDERVIISIEALESILREMGFGDKIKVCRGRPANHSIMVVRFNSTLSGLQAAERLHNIYAETKHGKSEFEDISSCSSSHTTKASEKKAEHVLYGYLGIAGDLDKLDFETRKRCLVKSKKEIKRIAMQP